MTSAREIKQIFVPLLENNTDIAQIGAGMLFIVPVHHIVLRVFIERSSHKDYCAPQWYIMEAFKPKKNFAMHLGRCGLGISRSKTKEMKHWTWADPDMVADAISVISEETLPFLRSMNSIDAFIEFYAREFTLYERNWPEDRVIVEIARGNLDDARKRLQALLPKYREKKDYDYLTDIRNMVMTVAEPLLADDRQELARILHGWEAANFRGTKFERYWEPTPFPLERT